MESQATTLQSAIIWFSDFEHCRQFMVELRWPDGVVKCPHCGSAKVSWLAKARVWKCYAKHERPTFTLKTGTIFEDSPIALEKWLVAAWLIISCKNGISSYEIHRGLGVTQKTAWFMLQRIRLAMQDDRSGGKLNGEIEIDETFIGGKVRNMHKDRKKRVMQGKTGGAVGKVPVQAMLVRGGQIRANVLHDREWTSLNIPIQDNIEPGAHLFTDEANAYFGLRAEYIHEFINHAEAYVRGNVHTNGLENFWSLLKRGLHGTYISVEPFHLFRYVDEQAFRFNTRKMSDAERFSIVMKQIVGRRVTYKQLTGKLDEIEPG
jgi:hypothetical protein